MGRAQMDIVVGPNGLGRIGMEPMRTRELHGPGYYLFGSQADPGYAEQMRAMNGREDEDPQRQDPPTFGSS